MTRSSWKEIVRGLIEYFIELRYFSVRNEESLKNFKWEATGLFSFLSRLYNQLEDRFKGYKTGK